MLRKLKLLAKVAQINFSETSSNMCYIHHYQQILDFFLACMNIIIIHNSYIKSADGNYLPLHKNLSIAREQL